MVTDVSRKLVENLIDPNDAVQTAIQYADLLESVLDSRNKDVASIERTTHSNVKFGVPERKPSLAEDVTIIYGEDTDPPGRGIGPSWASELWNDSGNPGANYE